MRLVLVPMVVVALSHVASAQSKRTSDDAWILLRGAGNHATMSGSIGDLKRVKTLRQGNEDLLWVRRGGTGFLIRDPQIVARAVGFFATMAPVEMKMEGYSRVMKVLSQRMETLARRMERSAGRGAGGEEHVSAQMEALSKEMDRLGKEMEKLGGEMERLGHEAERRLHSLVDEAIRAGKAVPAP